MPVTGSRRWIRSLGLDIEKPWKAWHSGTGLSLRWKLAYASMGQNSQEHLSNVCKLFGGQLKLLCIVGLYLSGCRS